MYDRIHTQMMKENEKLVEHEQVEEFVAESEVNGKTGEAVISQNKGVGIVLDDNAVLTDRDVMAILDVKENTLRKYRDEGYLSYRKVDISDKRWYLGSDIRAFLEMGYVQAYR